MRVKLICCDVFFRPVSALAAASPHIIDAEFVPMSLHNEPETLRSNLQRRIDEAAAFRDYDLFVLAYGLCGNTTAGLTCPVRLVMPRVHDCCALFMGSKERFLEAFGESLSMRWCTSGYYERSIQGNSWTESSPRSRETYPEYRALIEQYGEDNAEYIWETLHPEIETAEAAYITTEGFEPPGCREGFAEMIGRQGKALRLLEGDGTYLRDLVNGPWDDTRFLTLEPGRTIAAVYDMERVVTAV
jgi:hypothetical protein